MYRTTAMVGKTFLKFGRVVGAHSPFPTSPVGAMIVGSFVSMLQAYFKLKLFP
jgi:hypothetical protein